MRRSCRTATIGLALVAGLAAAATASAASKPLVLTPAPADGLSRALARGEVDEGTYALERARALVRPDAVAARYGTVRAVPPEAVTFVLRDLAARLGLLSKREREAARRLLARPPDGHADPVGFGWTEPEAAASPVCEPRFCVHWVQTGADAPPADDSNADGIPDWVDETVVILGQVFTRQVDELGFPPPKSDVSSGLDPKANPDGALDVYLSDLGDFGFYGYCTSDDPNAGNPAYPWYDVSAYCAVDNDFSPAQFTSGVSGQDANRVTIAHEVHHALQFALDYGEDIWLMEGGATMMETVVFPSILDNHQYLRASPLTQPAVPLDLGNTARRNVYGTWIFFEYLAQRFGGPEVMRDIWRRLDGREGRPDRYSIQGVRRFLGAQGRELRKVFSHFALVNRRPRAWYDVGPTLPGELKSPTAARYGIGRGAPRREGSLRVDHLSSRWVSFRRRASTPAGGKLVIRLDLPAKLRGSAAKAVVVRRGGERSARSFGLNRAGDGRLRLAFGANVRRVELLLVNGSSRFRCWEQRIYSCQGASRDDGGALDFAASLR